MKLREDLNPLRQATPLDTHKQLSLWNEYESARQLMHVGFMLAALAFGALLLFAGIQAIANRETEIRIMQAEKRTGKAEQNERTVTEYFVSRAKK